MQERCFGPIRFIPGENRGKYPFCHSVYIEGAGVLIDPSSNRERLKRLRDETDVKAIWLSHWHEDHFMHLDLFENVPLWISEPDAPMLAGLEQFLDGYGIAQQAHREFWRKILVEQFHFRPRNPAGFLQGGQQVQLGNVTVDIIHAPGHTPGHLCFFFREPKVLFLGDYDLTPFGPWYGDRESSIPQTITSVKRLKKMPAQTWLACHETGVFEKNPGPIWDRYLAVIQRREQKLLEFLATPRTMAQIVEAWIVYGRPREPREFYAFGEQAIMQKHLEILLAEGRVIQEKLRYRRIESSSG